MKKILIILLAALFSMVAFTGCYRDPNEERGQGNDEMLGNIILNPDSDFEGRVTIAVPDVQSHKTALTAFITSFNEKYPNITVVPEYFELNTYKNSVTNAAASAAQLGKPSLMYDLFWLPQEYINEWVSDQDILSPLTTLIEKDDSISVDELNTQMVGMSSIDNVMYMMPRDYNQVVMYYNKAIFDAAKIKYPTDEMSGAEFRDMCVRLATNINKLDKVKNDYDVPYSDAVSCIVDCNIAWSSLDYPLVKSFGGEVVNDKGEVVFESAETAAAIRYWKGLVETRAPGTGIALAIDTASGASNSGQQFRMQQAPIYLHSRSVMSDILNPVTLGGQEYLGVPKLGVAALPNFGGTYAIGAGCSGYGMYTDCANGTAAWQFLKHIISVEGQNAYSESGDCVPVRKDLLTDDTALWKNCIQEKLGTDFHHDAFIYKMDEAACSVNDFYPNVPFKAQVYVTARIEEAFRSCIQGKDDMFAANLKSSADKMKNDIAKAK